ncbi:6-bladed beta-propeller [Maribellus maritimus]|uniref:6-bladed beta-propeller n=1 Tax=Maribellus maritimus TaxID=2870838 RepID=UPI001EEC48CD|nr:6-bladed beta-propeller [Maribellus maritimus]MCG6189355.1 6-bladed beta-propeller [Maribellus maritimus]
MNQKQILLLALFSLFLVSCSEKSKTQNSKSFTILPVEKAITQSKAAEVNTMFENVEFIPLETNDKALMGEVFKIVAHKGFYYLYDDAGNLFRFDSQGSFVNRIGAIGKGPEEYSIIADFAIDKKNDLVIVNSLGKLVYYTTDGQFVKTLKSETNEQVMDVDDTGRIFYILPDNAQPAGVTYAEAIKVVAPDGTSLKTFTTTKIRHSGLSFFNSISQKEGTMYYKEEMGDVIYSINANLEKDSVYGFDLGKYAFQEEDFDMSAMEKWKNLYRLDKILIGKKYTCFTLQNGLIGKEICPLFWDGKELVFPHAEKDPSKKGLFINEIRITPMAESNGELVCLAALVDILKNKNSVEIKYKNLKNVDETSNPVLCVLR